jgi:hypothetical protein
MAVEQVGREVAAQVEMRGTEQAEAQRPGHGLADRRHCPPGFVDGSQRGVRMGPQRMGGLGGYHPAAEAVKQRGVEAAL